MPAAFAVTSLHKRFRTRLGRTESVALDGVDLEVPRGEAFGLIGPNGAGKTTFIKCLLGIAHPDRGAVELLGGRPEDPRSRARVGYLPERLTLPGAWTPRAFLASVARLKALRPERPGLDALLRRVGLADAGERRIRGFSKGMRQRLGLAAALVGTPDLLVLDEPTDGVDPLGRVEIRQLLAAELARGATLFINSHLLSETERICTRIGILSRGRLVRSGSLEVLTRVQQRWRVRFAPGPVAAEALVALGFEPAEGGAWEIAAPDAPALNRALDGARTTGALLVELDRASRDLEDVLTEALAAGAA
ncbi:MAG TPA: ABC transporter ATP-binding protein [Myxococcaceae bacterium]|nr:ABC transporter ATP-binding protein [Myxococcaceae bacterium]